MEIWKDIKGFEGLYQISNLGRVRALDRYVKDRRSKRLVKGHILALRTDKDYLSVSLWKNNTGHRFKVHRLVIEAFVPNPLNKRCTNHKDGNKKNNCADNLEWNTHSENNSHALLLGLRQSAKGERQGQSKLCNEQVWKIRALADNYNNAEIGRMFGVNACTVSAIVNRKSWKHI